MVDIREMVQLFIWNVSRNISISLILWKSMQPISYILDYRGELMVIIYLLLMVHLLLKTTMKVRNILKQ